MASHTVFINVFSRYVDSSKAVIEKADRSRLQPIALSCVLNIGACKLKMSNWQGAIDSCVEVSLCAVELFFFFFFGGLAVCAKDLAFAKALPLEPLLQSILLWFTLEVESQEPFVQAGLEPGSSCSHSL
jgi:hypothetical protein